MQTSVLKLTAITGTEEAAQQAVNTVMAEVQNEGYSQQDVIEALSTEVNSIAEAQNDLAAAKSEYKEAKNAEKEAKSSVEQAEQEAAAANLALDQANQAVIDSATNSSEEESAL